MDSLTLETKKSIMADFFCKAGGSRLLEWLEQAGFYEAPASVKHRNTYAGSLFDHSLQVTYDLIQLTEKLDLKWEREESPAVVGMLHDVCKMEDYVFEPEEVGVCLDGTPVYGEPRAQWRKRQLWHDHGDKSLIMLMGHIDLTEEEKACIRYHMGAFTSKEEWEYYTEAVRKYPNVLYTHTADMLAAHVKGV